MTRLANVEKAGYYPLPPTITAMVASHIETPQRGRILDPCAGEGQALLTLADRLNLEPFGIELHEGRAKKAREAVEKWINEQPDSQEPPTRLLHDSYLNLATTRGGFNLLFLNPPYDRDDEYGRLEYQWLVRTRPGLQKGGLLIWVVPQHLLGLRKATRYLLSWYEQIRLYRFPDDLYDRFKQIVLFGVHRTKSVALDAGSVEQLVSQASGRDRLPPSHYGLPTPLSFTIATGQIVSFQVPLPFCRPGRSHSRSENSRRTN